MAVCEACWAEATRMSVSNRRSVTENYMELIERPCRFHSPSSEVYDTVQKPMKTNYLALVDRKDVTQFSIRGTET